MNGKKFINSLKFVSIINRSAKKIYVKCARTVLAAGSKVVDKKRGKLFSALVLAAGSKVVDEKPEKLFYAQARKKLWNLGTCLDRTGSRTHSQSPTCGSPHSCLSRS
jgi:hypothetical protein